MAKHQGLSIANYVPQSRAIDRFSSQVMYKPSLYLGDKSNHFEGKVSPEPIDDFQPASKSIESLCHVLKLLVLNLFMIPRFSTLVNRIGSEVVSLIRS